MTDLNPLLSLLRSCVVRIKIGDEFRGTGFFVAPKEVLTCAHVVPAEDSALVGGDGWESTARVVAREPSLTIDSPHDRFPPLPDIALLRLDDGPPDHPCVRLETERPVAGAESDRLYLHGFTQGEHAPHAINSSPALVEYKGVLEEAAQPLFKFGGDQIRRGYSGSPALNVRTGSVCAVVESSRDAATDLGGFGVPISLAAEALPDLLSRNAAHHAADPTWERAVEAERAGEERRRGAGYLDLLPPLVEMEWTPDYPPSELLRARYGVVDLLGREEPKATLAAWRDSNRRFDVAVIAGAGGFGKTRLALEQCARAQLEGWTAGLFAEDVTADPDKALARLADWPGRLFVAIDYAETRPTMVGSLILRLSRRQAGPPVRLVLICRQAQTRSAQENLFAGGDGRDEILAVLRQAEVIRLDQQEVDRRRLFEAGLTAFSSRLGRAAPRSHPSLAASHFERPLFVLAAALLVAQNPDVDVDLIGSQQLMLELIDRHESQYWERSNDRLGPDFDLTLQRRCVALAAVLGAGSEAEALSLVGIVPGLEEAGLERRVVARWLSRLYGEGNLGASPALEPLEPDMLAEALVTREFSGELDLLGAALDVATDSQLVRALTVLTRAAASSPRLEDAFRLALDERLPDLVSRAAAKVDLVTSLDLAITAVRPLVGAATVPRGGPDRLVLGPLMPNIHSLAVEYDRNLAGRDRAEHLPGLALSLNHFAVGLIEVGRDEEAVKPIEESIGYYRELVEENPERYMSELSMALSHRTIALGQIGRHEEAVSSGKEAIELDRVLVAADREKNLAGLATSLNNLSISLSALGRDGAALEAVEESVRYYQELAAQDRGKYLADLSRSLNAQSRQLGSAGRSEDSLAPITEAVSNYRELVERDRARYLPDLAMSLGGLGSQLDQVGRSKESLAPGGEAVAYYRELVGRDRERFLADLAGALTGLMSALSHLGHDEEALAKAAEAVDCYRELVTIAAKHLLGLATALNNLSVVSETTGRHPAALEAIEESVEHYRTLVERDRVRHLADLARVLGSFSNRLEHAGRSAAATEPVTEAVGYYRELVEWDRVRYLPDLAWALGVLCDRLEVADQPEDSLRIGEEGLACYRELVEMNEARHLPEMAGLLNNLTTVLDALGRSEEAVGPIEEAVGHYRELVKRNPAHLGDLATALLTLSNTLSTVGRDEEALGAAEEAVAYRRGLGGQSPRNMSALAMALGILSYRLEDAGREADARELIGAAIEQYGELPGSETLFLNEATAHFQSGDIPAAVRAGWTALDKATQTRNRRDAVTTLGLLRQFRDRGEAAFDQAWELEVGRELPPWLYS
jgi:tetratricopeptide (TPR) repeat protein